MRSISDAGKTRDRENLVLYATTAHFIVFIVQYILLISHATFIKNVIISMKIEERKLICFMESTKTAKNSNQKIRSTSIINRKTTSYVLAFDMLLFEKLKEHPKKVFELFSGVRKLVFVSLGFYLF